MNPSIRRSDLIKASITYLLVLLVVIVLGIRYVEQKLSEQLNFELLKLEQRLHFTLQNFKTAPQILQASEVILNTLREPNAENIRKANIQLHQVNLELEADVSYLMNTDGITIASSNHDSADSFVGGNFSFRPYFIQAINGVNANYFALGSKSGKRGYYFASPVRDQQKIIGVIVIKVSLAFIDELSPRPDMDFVISDSDGVIFYSSRAAWLYKSMYILSDSKKQQIMSSLRYGDAELGSISQYYNVHPYDDTRVRLNSGKGEQSWIINSVHMLEWELHIYSLKQFRAVWPELLVYVLIYTLIMLLSLFLLLYVGKRRELQQHLRDMNIKLETRVKELTSDLRYSNKELRDLVMHYQKTQETLQDTENQLIQATKLAVLGELSAGLHHELAQPLQSLRSYTENCLKMIRLNKTQSMQHNLEEITLVCSTMTEIIKKFKIFARRTIPNPRPVSLEEIIAATWSIVRPKVKDRGVKFENTVVDAEIYCEPVLLEQVLVNLINNAIQAMADTKNPKIMLCNTKDDKYLYLVVKDNGPGVNSEQMAHMFDPFFTTKETGLGLGLTISKSIIESQGGTLDVKNRKTSGLKITIKLKLSRGEVKDEPNITR